MAQVHPFRVVGFAAWSTTLSDSDGWTSWSAVDNKLGESCVPNAAPAALRRRATPLGQKLLAAALSLEDVTEARYVLSSQHAEFARVPALLDVIRRREAVSPADFSMSVHHGLAGLLSIATHSRRGHSAISAGSESFCYGLLEVAACLAEGHDRRVIQLHYDEDPGDGFGALVPEWERGSSIVLALACATATSGCGIPIQMGMRTRVGQTARSGHALRFLDFVRSDIASAVSFGDRMVWEWQRV